MITGKIIPGEELYIPLFYYKDILDKIEMDKFKKDYPIFKDIEKIIPIVRSNIRIYNNEIMKEVRLGF